MDVRALAMYRLFLRESDVRRLLISGSGGNLDRSLLGAESIAQASLPDFGDHGFDAVILPLSEARRHARRTSAVDDASLSAIVLGAKAQLRRGGRLVGQIDHPWMLLPNGLRTLSARRLLEEAKWFLDPARRIRSALEHAGYVRVQVYFVDPDASRARALIPDQLESARSYFTNALIDSRLAYSWVGYQARLYLASVGMYSLLCKSLLFVADRP